MPDSKLEIQVLARNLAKDALKQAQEDLKGVGEAAKKSGEEGEKGSKKFAMSLTELKSGIDLAVGGLKTLAEVGQAAFDFAEQGAIVNQTAASFQGMGVSLKDLQTAARGTVDDMTLMSSTMTLMAGAGPELQQALGDAAPQLLEMAKAANKLNPRLGDTTFLYESIATAAKRQSAMIADNLGIVVKQGAAYENYAQKIGKAVTELTSEEQQLAFLNELLKSGNVLLEQAGGNTDSLTDGYARLTASTTNLMNEFSRAASEAGGFFDNLGKGVDGLAKWQKALNFARDNGLSPLGAQIEVVRDVLGASNTVFDQARAGTLGLAEEHARTWETLSQSDKAFDMYNQAQLRAATTTDYAAGAVQKMRDDTLSSLDAWNQYSQALAMSEAASAAASQKSYELAEAQRAAAQAAQEAQSAFLEGAAALGEYSTAQVAQQQIDALRTAMEQGKLAPEEFAAAQQNVLVGFGLLTDAEIAAQARLDGLTQLYTSGAITAQEYAAQSLATKQALDTVTAAEAEAAAKAAELADKKKSVAQKAQEMEAALAAAQGTLATTSSGMGTLSSSAASASGAVETLRQKIAMLEDKIVRVTYETIGTQEGNITNAQAAAAVAESKENAGYAAGGIVPKAGMYPVGERGPEMVALPGGARVFNAQDTRRMQQQGGGVVVHAPVTIQATINSMLDVAVIADQVSREIGRRVRQYTS